MGKIHSKIQFQKKLFILSFILGVRFNQAYADIPYVQGVNYIPQHYSGYYDEENKNFLISDDDIEKDMFLMASNFDGIRTYEYDPINLQRILRAAKRYGMKVALGIEVDANNLQYTESQTDGLNAMFTQYPDLIEPVITIIVGNEVLKSSKSIDKDIQAVLQQVNKIAKFTWFQKANIPISVSEKDDLFISQAGANLLQRLPKNTSLFVNINPYMAGCSLDGAIRNDASCKYNSFPDKWEQLNNPKFTWLKGHQMIIGETGWPTEGPGAESPVATRPGSLTDAVDYYTFVYKFLNIQKIQNKQMSIPFFAFVAFDQPMNGVFGFANNFWGVYNFDSTPKYGMVYPLQRDIKPKDKLGTNIKIHLINSTYNNAKLPVIFSTGQTKYTNKTIVTSQKIKKNTDSEVTYSFMTDYPYVEYSNKNSNIVSLILPQTGNPNYPAATCTNRLISGNGYGPKNAMTLKWATPFSNEKDEACKYVNWAENGVFIVGGQVSE